MAKIKLPLRRFGEDMEKSVKLEKEFSNKTPICRNKAFVSLNCPVCGICFERKASEVKRHSSSCCSRACSAILQRRQVKTNCKICGKEFSVKQSYFGKVTCCSNECKRELLRKQAIENDGPSGVFKTRKEKKV